MSRKRRNLSPLDQTELRDLALSYVARFSTTRAKLVSYLHRKVRERGVKEDAGELDIATIADRLVELRYIDDGAYAQARTAGLLRKGYGRRRVDETLRAAGIDEAIRSELVPDEVNARKAALLLARKRSFGPFVSDYGSAKEGDPKKREKQIAAMVRAGHDFGMAKAIIDAGSIEEAEEWAYEAEDWQ